MEYSRSRDAPRLAESREYRKGLKHRTTSAGSLAVARTGRHKRPMSEIEFHTLPDGPRSSRRIACRFTPAGPDAGGARALGFLPGYMSDRAGGKASAVFDWARGRGRACLLLDYSGCGESSGDFAQGTLSRWREEVLAVIDAHALDR